MLSILLPYYLSPTIDQLIDSFIDQLSNISLQSDIALENQTNNQSTNRSVNQVISNCFNHQSVVTLSQLIIDQAIVHFEDVWFTNVAIPLDLLFDSIWKQLSALTQLINRSVHQICQSITRSVNHGWTIKACMYHLIHSSMNRSSEQFRTCGTSIDQSVNQLMTLSITQWSYVHRQLWLSISWVLIVHLYHQIKRRHQKLWLTQIVTNQSINQFSNQCVKQI